MYPRTKYEMTIEDLEKLLEAMKPVPYMMIGGVPPVSQQENANRAWAILGHKMGFDPMTVQPTGQGDRFFSAIPSETPEKRAEREAAEKESKRTQEIETLKNEIADRKNRILLLEAQSK